MRAFWSLLASRGATKPAGAAQRRKVTFAQLVQAQMSNGADAQDAHTAGSASHAHQQGLKHGNHLLWEEQGRSQRTHTSLRHLRSWLSKGPRKFRLQESVGWLDELMQDVWPHIATWLKAKVVQVVEPAINSLLPPFLQGAHFEELSFGNQPPSFGPLSLYSTEDKAGIEIRLGVKLVSDMTAWLSAVGLRLGISKVKLEGTLSLVFRPLRDWPPFFSGMEIYLMNPPTLEFEFHGAGKIAEFPTIRPLVRNTIATLIANRLVLPNRIAVDMDEEDETDIADLKKSDPHLVLRLEVVRARALLAADVGLLGPSSSDPYVVVTLGATRHTSPVIMRNLNPQWNFTADFPVHDPSQLMYFSVYDHDHYTADDLIGVASGIGLGSLVDEGEVVLPLEGPQGEEGAGTLTVQGRYLELTQESKSSCGAYLAVKVRQVRGLQHGADFPFKVVASAAGVEGTSKGSYAPQGRAVSLDMQAICAKLLGEGRSREVVAQILGLDVEDVLRILNRRSPNDPALQKAVQDAMKEGAARNPQFEDVVQLLLPDAQAAQGPCTLHLRLLNKQNALVAEAAIELKRVKEAPNMRLEGPFVLTKPSGDRVAELLGSVRLRFTKELEGGSFSLTEAA